MAFERRRPTPLALLTRVQPMISATPPQFSAVWGEFVASECPEPRSTLQRLPDVSAASLKFAATFTHHVPAFAGGIRTVSQNRRTEFRLITLVRRIHPQQNSKVAASNLTTPPQIFGGFNSTWDHCLHRKCTASAFQMNSR